MFRRVSNVQRTSVLTFELDRRSDRLDQDQPAIAPPTLQDDRRTRVRSNEVEQRGSDRLLGITEPEHVGKCGIRVDEHTIDMDNRALRRRTRDRAMTRSSDNGSARALLALHDYVSLSGAADPHRGQPAQLRHYRRQLTCA